MKTADWRWLRNQLQTLACTIEIGTIEYRNTLARIRWIERNRL